MIYFLYGEDSYRSKKKLEEIIGGYKKVHKSGLNLVYADLKEKKLKDVLDGFKIVSMFAEKKLAIFKNVFSNTKIQDEFLEALKDLQKINDVVVVFEDGAVDQRIKLFKNLQKYAKCQEFKFLSPVLLKKWIAAEFAKNNAKIDFGAESLLLTFVGNDLWQMANEINRLSNYKKGEIITKKDVENLIRPNPESDIFKTIDALASKDKSLALSLLHRHLDNGDNSLYLLSMIAYQFRNILIIKELVDEKNPYAGIVKKSGLHPFVVKKTYSLCNQFTMEQLKKIYLKIFQIDSDIKTGRIDAELALDMLVSEI
jgi:DNA polymerase-3 subunit delta